MRRRALRILAEATPTLGPCSFALLLDSCILIQPDPSWAYSLPAPAPEPKVRLR